MPISTSHFIDRPRSSFARQARSRGDVAGEVVINEEIEGFVRFATGNFSPPFVSAGGSSNLFLPWGINRARVVTGSFPGKLGEDGFLLDHGKITRFDIANAIGTYITGINDAGDFVGSYAPNDTTGYGFVNLAGSVTDFNVPGVDGTSPYGINNLGEIVGLAVTGGTGSGFYRDAGGNYTIRSTLRAHC